MVAVTHARLKRVSQELPVHDDTELPGHVVRKSTEEKPRARNVVYLRTGVLQRGTMSFQEPDSCLHRLRIFVQIFRRRRRRWQRLSGGGEGRGGGSDGEGLSP